MIVADANTLIYLVCATPLTDLARRVYAVDADWTAPALWEAEVLNALAVMRRHRLIDRQGAVNAWRSAAAAIAGRARACDAVTVLATAEQTGLSAYDAQYVALARAMGVPLVTEDRRVLRACPGLAWSMQAFLNQTSESASAP